MKNYDDLRPTNFLVPRILVVVRVPEEPGEWTEQTDDQLVLRHCGYWLSLRGFPESENTANVTVQIPVEQRFTVQALQTLMNRIGTGVHP